MLTYHAPLHFVPQFGLYFFLQHSRMHARSYSSSDRAFCFPDILFRRTGIPTRHAGRQWGHGQAGLLPHRRGCRSLGLVQETGRCAAKTKLERRAVIIDSQRYSPCPRQNIQATGIGRARQKLRQSCAQGRVPEFCLVAVL